MIPKRSILSRYGFYKFGGLRPWASGILLTKSRVWPKNKFVTQEFQCRTPRPLHPAPCSIIAIFTIQLTFWAAKARGRIFRFQDPSTQRFVTFLHNILSSSLFGPRRPKPGVWGTKTLALGSLLHHYTCYSPAQFFGRGIPGPDSRAQGPQHLVPYSNITWFTIHLTVWIRAARARILGTQDRAARHPRMKSMCDHPTL